MIKNSTYIRKFTPRQKQQLECVAKQQGLKTTPEILFFVLDKYLEQIKDIERLNRLLQYKQNKIDKLNENNN